jgi:hypothetical protein
MTKFDCLTAFYTRRRYDTSKSNGQVM